MWKERYLVSVFQVGEVTNDMDPTVTSDSMTLYLNLGLSDIAPIIEE